MKCTRNRAKHGDKQVPEKINKINYLLAKVVKNKNNRKQIDRNQKGRRENYYK